MRIGIELHIDLVFSPHCVTLQDWQACRSPMQPLLQGDSTSASSESSKGQTNQKARPLKAGELNQE